MVIPERDDLGEPDEDAGAVEEVLPDFGAETAAGKRVAQPAVTRVAASDGPWWAKASPDGLTQQAQAERERMQRSKQYWQVDGAKGLSGRRTSRSGSHRRTWRSRARNGGIHTRSDSIGEPLRTLTTKDRLGLVQPMIADILFRMLQPHECAAGMGFPQGYRFAGNRGEIMRQVGNAVEVHNATALCEVMVADVVGRRAA